MTSQTMHRSSNAKISVAVLLLLIFYPIGLLFLIFAVKWGRFEKVITAFATLGAWFFILGGIIAPALLVAINPLKIIREANVRQCNVECQSSKNPNCVEKCVQEKSEAIRYTLFAIR